ncbi:MAG: DUF4242 domain-containing protein [Gemmatimonadetes bacterium]|nr:DUF4242 domain-containing protein [Gemmatimonadota bacterium]
MPRYIVERTFSEGLRIPLNGDGQRMCCSVVDNNAEHHVTWIRSFVTKDKSKTFCVYDAPSPEAVRLAARRNGLPVDRVVEVSVLDPYFYA